MPERIDYLHEKSTFNRTLSQCRFKAESTAQTRYRPALQRIGMPWKKGDDLRRRFLDFNFCYGKKMVN